VRAGLLPALLAGYLPGTESDWRIVDVKPGTDPIGRLSRELSAHGLSQSTEPEQLRINSRAILEAMRKCITRPENLLILVDQFEELFRFRTRPDPVEDRDEKAAFVRLLIETAHQTEATETNEDKKLPIYVVFTLRSEYLGKCAEFRDLPEEVDNTQFLVPRMNREQRRRAIEGPVCVAGATIASQLVQQLLNDTGDDPDQLPVLQHALMRTWNNWRRRGEPSAALQMIDYETVGGIRRAIDQHADEAWADASKALPQSGDRIVRRLFQCLRQRDADGGESRRLAITCQVQAIGECTPEELNTALECFQREGRTFVVRSGDELDITHEALLRKWERLKRWAEEEEDDRIRYERLLDYARGGVRLTGKALMDLSSWWAERKPTEAWAARYDADFTAARNYLENSAQEERKEREKENERQRAEQRAKRYKRMGLLATAAGCLLLLAAWYVTSAISQQRDRAVAQMLASKAAVAGLEGGERTEAAVLLAVESLKRMPNLDTQFVLSKILGILPDRVPMPNDLRARHVGLTSDGKRLIAATETTLQVYGLTERATLASAPVANLTAFALDGQGTTVVIGTKAGAVNVWSVNPLQQVRELSGCKVAVRSMVISHDGSTVAAICDQLYVWTAVSGWRARVQRLQGPKESYDAIALNENGSKLAAVVVGWDTILKVHDLPSFRSTGRREIEDDDVHRLHVSSSESSGLMVIAATRHGVRSWRFPSQDSRADHLLKHSQPVLGIAVSADGNYVVTGSQDGVARLWNVREEREVARMLVGAPVHSVALTTQAGLMAAAGTPHKMKNAEEGTTGMVVQVWKRPGLRFAGEHFVGTGVDGRYLLAKSAKEWSLWDADKEEKLLAGPTPDGFWPFRIEASRALGTLRRAGTSELSLTAKRFEGNKLQETLWTTTIARESERRLVVNAFVSDDGRYLAIQSLLFPGNQVDLIETATGRVVKVYPHRRFLAFVPNSSSMMMLNSQDSSLVSASLSDGSESALLLPEVRGLRHAEFSPSGNLLIGASVTGPAETGSHDEVGETSDRNRLFLWQWPSKRLLAAFPIVGQMATFAANSEHMMVVEPNGTIHIWRLAASAVVEVARLTQGSGNERVGFLPSGGIAIFNSDGYSTVSWNDIASQACIKVKRNLTRAEWATFVPDEPYPKEKTCPGRP
jgi:WD40 repeat protein